MTDKFLDKVYDARTADETRELYDAWSASYEAEVAENGYATPGRCAEALAKHLTDKDAPILDFGCGTGLSGLALKLAGFTTIDGVLQGAFQSSSNSSSILAANIWKPAISWTVSNSPTRVGNSASGSRMWIEHSIGCTREMRTCGTSSCSWSAMAKRAICCAGC